MSTTRLWAVLAVLLPVLAALIANLSSVDLTYHLRAGSPAINAGVRLTSPAGVGTDRAGVTRASPPEIGPYER